MHFVLNVCVSSVWAGPLCGSVPCCVGRPSVRGGPLCVGPLWVPSFPVFPSFHVAPTRLKASRSCSRSRTQHTHNTHNETNPTV